MDRNEIRAEVSRMLDLLRIEKSEDLTQYLQAVTGTSLIERRKQGVCWYPIKIERTHYDSGERLLVRASRTPEHNDSHQFQSGKSVSLFVNNDQKGEFSQSVTGVVNQVYDREMLITINADEEPDWFALKNLGIQLLFDETTYREMEYALSVMMEGKNERLNYLMRVLIGGLAPQQRNDLFTPEFPSLNPSQNKAVKLIDNAIDVAIVHGPPGTGKTTTLVQAIVHTLKAESQVLVCAPSNAAVDLLAERLSQKGVFVVRLGHPSRVTDENLNLTLDFRITRHEHYADMKAARRKAEETRKLARKFKRNFGAEEREERRQMLAEAGQLDKDARQLEYFIINNILTNAQVIACTLVGASHIVLKGKQFQTVFIDEAAQALEPATWIPLLKSKRVVLAGDHCQLPPTIKSQEAARGGLEVTLFEKLIKKIHADTMLQTQYRMNRLIMNFSSRQFYNNELQAHPSVENHLLFADDKPLEFIDTAGCGFAEDTDAETRSTYNREEADVLIKHLLAYVETLQYHTDVVPSIGIIAPYRAQVNVLKQLMQNASLPAHVTPMVQISTVDSFQGQERDVIYISLVRSNPRGGIGFLENTRRMNVAMTRARKKLVVVADSSTICQHPFYEHFYNYTLETEGTYRSAYELMY